MAKLDPRIVVNRYIFLVGRLKPGITAAQGNREPECHRAPNGERASPTEDQLAFELVKPGFLGNVLSGSGEWRSPGMMVLAGLVLLAACANLGGLFAARTTDRARELAIRVAVGAAQDGSSDNC